MTATLDDVATRKNGKPEPTAEQKLAEELVARAREQGVSLTGPAHRPALDPPPATTRLRTGNPAGQFCAHGHSGRCLDLGRGGIHG